MVASVASTPPALHGSLAGAKLVCRGSPSGKSTFSLDRAVTLFGSKPRAHVRLLSSEVSGIHALIANVSGRLYLRDLASRKGTYVNGVRVHEAFLKAGDVLRVGSFALELSLPDSGHPSSGPSLAAEGHWLGEVAELRRDGDRPPVRVETPVFLIGQRAGADLLFDDPLVSNSHAALVHEGSGWLLLDLGSRSGTEVNDVRIRRAHLLTGDRIRIGRARLTFETRAAGSPQAPATPPAAGDEAQAETPFGGEPESDSDAGQSDALESVDGGAEGTPVAEEGTAEPLLLMASDDGPDLIQFELPVDEQLPVSETTTRMPWAAAPPPAADPPQEDRSFPIETRKAASTDTTVAHPAGVPFQPTSFLNETVKVDPVRAPAEQGLQYLAVAPTEPPIGVPGENPSDDPTPGEKNDPSRERNDSERHDLTTVAASPVVNPLPPEAESATVQTEQVGTVAPAEVTSANPPAGLPTAVDATENRLRLPDEPDVDEIDPADWGVLAAAVGNPSSWESRGSSRRARARQEDGDQFVDLSGSAPVQGSWVRRRRRLIVLLLAGVGLLGAATVGAWWWLGGPSAT